VNSPERLAIFGGSFDPIHHGHLILARDAVELLELDEIRFVPAALSPHKPGTQPVAPELRAEMVAAAICGEPRFVLDNRELLRPAPSYSIDTVESLKTQFPGARLFFLIGADNLAKLDSWRRFKDLRNSVEFVVFGRGSSSLRLPHGFPTLERRLDISSTEIRQRVAQGLPIRYWVPEAVDRLILQHHLYRS
jgi:nicotinate-nucleotide adenylyltransferase